MAIKLADTLAPMADFPAVMAEHTAFEDGETLQEKYETGQLGGGGGGYTQLSQAEYDALSEDEKMNGKEYRTYDTGHIYKLGIEYGKDACFTSLSQLGLTADATVEDVVNALKNGESFLAPVNTFTNYETIFPNKVPSDQWNKIHIIKGSSLGNSHIRCFSQSGAVEYLANINNTNVVSWNDVSGTYIDISDSIVEKLGNEILKYPVGKYRINSTTTGNKFIDLPSDAEIKCGLIEVNGTAVGKSPFTDTWVYRMYKFECLTGTSSYVRRLNSGATAGVIQIDTGWQQIATKSIYEEPIILRYNMPETFSYSKYGITHNNTITEVVRAIGNYYASKYDTQNITVQVILSTNYNSNTFNMSLPCNGRSSITTITYMPYKFASRVKIETMNTHTGETYLGSLNDSETDDIVWKQIATKDYVDNAVGNSGNTFNGKEVKSITIDLSASAFQVKGTSLYKIALDNYISANTNVIKVEGYYIPPTDANSTYKDKRYIVHTSDSDRAGGIRYYDGSWTACVCQSESGSKKGSGFAKIYYV